MHPAPGSSPSPRAALIGRLADAINEILASGQECVRVKDLTERGFDPASILPNIDEASALAASRRGADFATAGSA